MSPVKTIKAFRDLLAFLTIIPISGNSADFVFGAAEHMYLFPIIGGFLGLLAATYYFGASHLLYFLLGIVNSVIPIPVDLFSRLLVSAMTIACLLVLTGLQHFDGVIDLGNTFGLRNVHDRNAVAHAWTVTYWGAFLAFAVEFVAFIGLFLINPFLAIGAIIAAEVSAKLAMVTLVWIGKPSHKGLGSIFIQKAKNKLNVLAYLFSIVIVYPFFALAGKPFLGLIIVGLVFVSIIVALLMQKVGNKVFGGVSGDMIGATNEVARAVTLILTAVVLVLL